MWEAAQTAEQAFLGFTSINKHYGVDVKRLSLWEYMLLCEKLRNEVKQLEKK